MSQDILGHNRMPLIWECLDIHQLTGMSWDIPGCPSCMGLHTSYYDVQDVPGHPGTQ